MGLSERDVILLGFRYQTYLTYISVAWTIGISFFIGLLSYVVFSIDILSMNLYLLLILLFILLFVEVAFLSVYFWLNSKKENIEKIVRRSFINNEVM